MANLRRRLELIRRFQSGHVGPIAAQWIQRLKAGVCPLCGNPIMEGEFRDDLSRKEFELSHICQLCQDDTFSARDDDDDHDSWTCRKSILAWGAVAAASLMLTSDYLTIFMG